MTRCPMLAETALPALAHPATLILLLGAMGTACVHTLAGPDHYLPFIVMGRARRWSLARTVGWTTLCGVGHVGSSVLLALAAVLLGYGLEHVTAVQAWRGDLAGWALVAFGLAYLSWALWRGPREHDHGSAATPEGFRLTPWVLFVIFVLGPCEPLVPLVMYPAAHGAWFTVGAVVAGFAVLTILSMLAVVLLAARGMATLRWHGLERHRHAVAGGTVLLAGCAIQFLGL